MNILTVFGTRPEAIKLAPVIRELRARRTPAGGRLRVITCSTGQHREMLDPVTQLFGIAPDHDLNLMQPGQSLAALTSRILTELDAIIRSGKPDYVMVQGDTTTTAAASLAAYLNRVPVAHVEAGLRTEDKWQPFPEEVNRRVASVIADLHFAPTELAQDNLLREGVPPHRIFVTGNTVIDALLWVAALPDAERCVAPELSAVLSGPGRVVLVTAHRRENFGEPLANICRALRELAARYNQDVQIVFPVHLNPEVQACAHTILAGVPGITLTAPLDYPSLVAVLKRAHFVLTDSGGLQEESPGFGVPVLVLRNKTERPEGIAAGCVKLIGTEQRAIIEECVTLLQNPAVHKSMATRINPYGDGRAAARIADVLTQC